VKEVADMTGPEPDDRPDDQLDEQDEHVEIRRLLADARHTEPMPADVSARMDAVLADLSGSRPVGDVRVDAPAVVSLASYRRRRAGGLLVAAAAIVIAGIAVTQHLPNDLGAATSSATGAGPASDANGEAQAGAPSPQNRSSRAATGTPKLTNGRVVVHARSFPADATAAQRLTERSYAADRASPTPSAPPCVAAPAGSHTVPATFQGARAALVFLRPEGDTQVVDLYLCGQPQPVRSVTLPAP
jgi:hypothetical protein